ASAPRYGLPTRTTPAPPTSATTTGRHGLRTWSARHPASSRIPATNTPRPTVPTPAYRPPVSTEYPATPLNWSRAPVTTSTATTAAASAAMPASGPAPDHQATAASSAAGRPSVRTAGEPTNRLRGAWWPSAASAVGARSTSWRYPERLVDEVSQPPAYPGPSAMATCSREVVSVS